MTVLFRKKKMARDLLYKKY